MRGQRPVCIDRRTGVEQAKEAGEREVDEIEFERERGQIVEN